MPTWEVWYRTKNDGRAPDTVIIDTDYADMGDIEALTPKEAYLKLYKASPDMENPPFEGARCFKIGDIIVNKTTKQSYILSELLGAVTWAMCKVLY